MTNVIQVKPLLLLVHGDLLYSELSPIHSIIRETLPDDAVDRRKLGVEQNNDYPQEVAKASLESH